MDISLTTDQNVDAAEEISSLVAMDTTEMEENVSMTENLEAVSTLNTNTDALPSAKRRKFFQRGIKKIQTVRGRMERQTRTRSTSSDAAEVRNDLTEVKSKLETVVDMLKNLKVKPSNEPKKNELQDLNLARATLIQACKSMEELIVHAGCIVTCPSDDYLYCEMCIQEPWKIKAGTGKFAYKFEDFGVDFSKREGQQPRQFINLKRHICDHLKSKEHMKRQREISKLEDRNNETRSRSKKVGMVLGRAAYQILKNGDAYSKYEDYLSVLKVSGLDIGNINHSRKFVSSLVRPISEALDSRLKHFLQLLIPSTGRATPICVLADKLTPNRTTFQIIGIFGFIAQKFQSLVLALPALGGNTGFEVTKCLKAGLDCLDLNTQELRERMVGGAFDGEYITLGVGPLLNQALLIEDLDSEWYSYFWDPAHILELAVDGTRKVTDAAEVCKFFKFLNEISKKFGHGKSYRELLMEAHQQHWEEEEDKETENEETSSEISDILQESRRYVRTPLLFSETRFATYSYRVLKSFLHNFKYYYVLMNNRKDDDLDRINNSSFLFTLAGLIDIFNVISAFSLTCQKPRTTPFELLESKECFVKMITEMEKELCTSSKEINETIKSSVYFPTLAAVFSEVSDTSCFRGCSILIKTHVATSTRSHSQSTEANLEDHTLALLNCSKKLSKYLDAFLSQFVTRMNKEDERSPILKHINAFDVNAILKFDVQENIPVIPSEVLQSLNYYANLARRTSNLSLDINDLTLEKEYQIFVKRVKEEAPRFVATSPSSRYRQLELFEAMLNQKRLYSGIPNILHLLATVVCRNKCEAVVEGMGSVVKYNSALRGSLDYNRLEKETKIRWQGPHPASSDATRLIQLALDNHFTGRDWHFVSEFGMPKFSFQSKVQQRVMESVKSSTKLPF